MISKKSLLAGSPSSWSYLASSTLGVSSCGRLNGAAMICFGKKPLFALLAVTLLWTACLSSPKPTVSGAGATQPSAPFGTGAVPPNGSTVADSGRGLGERREGCTHSAPPKSCVSLSELWPKRLKMVGERVRVTGRLTQSAAGAVLSAYPAFQGDVRVILRGSPECADDAGQVALDVMIAPPPPTPTKSLIMDGWGIEFHDAEIVGTPSEQCRD